MVAAMTRGEAVEFIGERVVLRAGAKRRLDPFTYH